MSLNRVAKLSIWVVLVISAIACSNDNDFDPTIVDEQTRSINNYFLDNMEVLYLWNDQIPSNVDPDREPDPNTFFNNLLYKQEDRWSYITDDYEALVNSLNGIDKTFGHNFNLYKEKNTDKVYGIITYVVKNSPAYMKALTRGEIFNRVNGIDLTAANYKSLLFESQNYTLGFADIIGGELVDLDKTVEMNAGVVQEHPIYLDSIYDINGNKFGYIVFNQFIANYNADLELVISRFKNAGVQDVILDLRYNPGGSIGASLLLGSMLAPEQNARNRDIYARYIWNDIVADYWLEKEGAESENLILKLLDNTVNLNINRLFVLTTGKTASASELLINGLRPYSDIILIGDTTSGKYTGSITIHDSEKSFDWAIQPIVLKTANVNFETDFKEGFIPDYLVKDDLFSPLGNIEESMLGHAVSLITGIPVGDLARKDNSRLFQTGRYIGNNQSYTRPFMEIAILDESSLFR